MMNSNYHQSPSTNAREMTWKEIFSQSFQKHSRAELEHIMQTGTVIRRVPEPYMLRTWKTPRLWWAAGKYGIGMILALYATLFICMEFVETTTVALIQMTMIIPPLIIPIIIMIFLWEMNVPQNISLMELLAYFFVGGLLSFAICSVMFHPFPDELPIYYAAVREEPAKLGAALVILLYYNFGQNRKLYGMTGIVIGAAVGAAFSGIESVSYAISYSGTMEQMMNVQLLRAFYAIAGHVAYCVPYMTAIALHAENGKFTATSILNFDTILAFGGSTVLHAMWNGTTDVELMQPLLTVVAVLWLGYWVKRGLNQMIAICGRSRAPEYAASVRNGQITLYCGSGPVQGMRWQSEGNTLVIGRQRERCGICVGSNAPGVSSVHCRIYRTTQGWMLQDLGSSYGTYVAGRRLNAQEACLLRGDEKFFLGSKRVWFHVSIR